MEAESQSRIGTLPGLMGTAFLFLLAQGGAMFGTAILYRLADEPGPAPDWVSERLLGVAVATWVIAIPFGLVFGRWALNCSWDGLGLQRKGLGAAALRGAVLGMALAGIPIGLFWLLGAYSVTVEIEATGILGNGGAAPAIAILLAVAGIAVCAFGEELFIRGLALGFLLQKMPHLHAVVISSLLFSALHAANPESSPSSLFGVFVAGLLLAELRLQRANLWAPTGLHLAWNATIAVFFGLPVSGFSLPAVVRLSPPDGRIETLFLGGPFGPESGLLFIGALLLAWLVEIRRGRRAVRGKEAPPGGDLSEGHPSES